MFGTLDISTSGLIAQRTRLETIAANLANQNAIYDADGNYSPFQRRIAVFEQGDPASDSDLGVHVGEIMLDDAPLMAKHEPGHPEADEDGYVYYPNVNPIVEQVNAMEASRAYEANITAAEATKSMMRSAMTLLA